MKNKTNPVSLYEAKILVSEKVRDKKTADDVFIKGILFLAKHSTWRRRKRRPPDLDEMVRRLEVEERNKGKVQ